jgi:cytoskeletal protein RodZ
MTTDMFRLPNTNVIVFCLSWPVPDILKASMLIITLSMSTVIWTYVMIYQRLITRNHNLVLSSFMTYHQICDKGSTTDVTSLEGTAYHSGGNLLFMGLVFCLSWPVPDTLKASMLIITPSMSTVIWTYVMIYQRLITRSIFKKDNAMTKRKITLAFDRVVQFYV